MLRFVAWALSRLMYRVKIIGRDNLPRHGPAVLVCNHVTFIDWLIVSAASPVPLRFVMHYSFINMPVARHVFKAAKLIPIAGAKEDAKVLDEAFDAIADALNQGEVVCIFPEGKLTTDGAMNAFRPGIEKIIARTPAPVVPMALVGMWGSFFSKATDKGFMKRLRSRVKLIIATPVSPPDVKADALETQVKQLGGFT